MAQTIINQTTKRTSNKPCWMSIANYNFIVMKMFINLWIQKQRITFLTPIGSSSVNTHVYYKLRVHYN